MKLENCNPIQILDAATQALDELEDLYKEKKRAFYDEHRQMPIEPWFGKAYFKTLSDEEIENEYAFLLGCFKVEQRRDAATLRSIIDACEAANAIHATVSLEENEIKLILPYMLP